MAANLTLTVFRADPMQIRLQVQGIDLTNAAPSLAVRLCPDDPGAPLLQLGATTTPGANGCRIVGVVLDANGIPTTLIEILASKATMATLPPAAEVGSDLTLAYDLQWTPPTDGSGFTAEETTVLFGDFVVKGSVNV